MPICKVLHMRESNLWLIEKSRNPLYKKVKFNGTEKRLNHLLLFKNLYLSISFFPFLGGWVYVCVCRCVCVGVCVCVCLGCMWVYGWVCVWVCVGVCVCVWECMFLCMCVYVCGWCLCVCMCVGCMCVYVCVSKRWSISVVNLVYTAPLKIADIRRLPPISQTIQLIRPQHAGHCCWSLDELKSDVFLWTTTHGHTSAGWPAKTYIYISALCRHLIQCSCVDCEGKKEARKKASFLVFTFYDLFQADMRLRLFLMNKDKKYFLFFRK